MRLRDRTPRKARGDARADGAQLRQIAELIDAGKIRVSLAKTLPLAACAAALDESRTGHVRGKIVLKVQG